MRLLVIAGLVLLGIIRIVTTSPDNEENKKNLNFDGRSYLQNKLTRWLPGDTGALAAGILLGGDDDLSYKATLQFRKSGLSHITAASGFNVVVVSGWIVGMFTGWMGRKRAISFGIVCILLYMLLAGMTVPVIRAGLMVMLGNLGLLWGRKSDAWWGLGLTSLGMIIYKPVWVFDISFQLSVAATAGVLYVSGPAGGWVSNFKTSLAAWIATLPIILHYFGQLSLVAPLANLGLVWTVPPVMEILGLAAVVGLIWDTGGWLVALLAWPGLKLILSGSSWFASWPGSSLQADRMSWLWVIGYYLTVGLVLYRYHKTRG